MLAREYIPILKLLEVTNRESKIVKPDPTESMSTAGNIDNSCSWCCLSHLLEEKIGQKEMA